jgi:hypothetical protein
VIGPPGFPVGSERAARPARDVDRGMSFGAASVPRGDCRREVANLRLEMLEPPLLANAVDEQDPNLFIDVHT